MKAVDTNVLVYSHRREMPMHNRAFALLKELTEGDELFAIPWPCLHEFYSIVTNPRIFKDSCSTPEQATEQIAA